MLSKTLMLENFIYTRPWHKETLSDLQFYSKYADINCAMYTFVFYITKRPSIWLRTSVKGPSVDWKAPCA